MNYVTGQVIRDLREKRGLTQKELAEKLALSDKTISKWENNKGLPDIGIIAELAEVLGVSVAELLAGEYLENTNRAGNIRKTAFYVCPLCGNVIPALGGGSYSCCGITLPRLEAEAADPAHPVNIETIDDEYYVSLNHAMNKEHYLSFIAYVTTNRLQLVKLYPEQSPEARFTKHGHGYLYAYCNRHGLYRVTV